jgi:hypothetical protein
MAIINDKNVYLSGSSVNRQDLETQAKFVNPPGYSPPVTLSEEDDSCTQQCCSVIEKEIINWYGCLPVNNIIWGLTYRLGLVNINFNNFNLFSTISNVFTNTNFDIFLQLNPEQSFNNMDVSGPENYTIANETTGQVNLMAAKLLLQGIGSGEVSETAIQNPILFDVPYGKIDKLTFKMYYDDSQLSPLWLVYPFDLLFSEWNATFQIDEEVAYTNRDTGWGHNPTVHIPNNPSGFQYLALTTTNNPNNK